MKEVTLVLSLVLITVLTGRVNGDIPLPNQDLVNRLQSLANSNPQLLQQWSASQSEVMSSQLMRLALPSYIQKFLEIFENSKRAGTLEEFSRSFFTGVDSTDCRGHILEWMHRLVSDDLKWTTEKDKWAAHLIDSWGKLPEGILTGHISSYGDFAECVQVKATNIEVLNRRHPEISKNFEGSYCTSNLLPAALIAQLMGAEASSNQNMEKGGSDFTSRKARGVDIWEAQSVTGLLEQLATQKITILTLIPSVGTCMPNSCSVADTQALYMNAVNMTYSLINDTAITDLLPLPIVAGCSEGKKKDLDGATIFMIAFLAVLLAFCLGTGVVDYFLNHGVDKPPERGILYKYVMAFSFYNNTKKWMSTRRSAEDLGCLHGIRFLSTAWVVLGHTYVTFMNGPQWNKLDLINMYKEWPVLAVINGTFSVDTFFVMSGMLATYNILKLLDKTKGKFNIPLFYLHRYVRITPTYAILVGIAATIPFYLGSGPLWNTSMTQGEQYCRDNWWANLLYINNIYKAGESCNGESWYLANDMQFYILSPFIVYPIWKWKKFGLPALAILTALSIVSPALVSHYQNAPPAMIMSVHGEQLLNITKIYHRPWTRIQTFLVGVWLGWILHVTKGRKLKLPWWIVGLGWIASTALALTVIFSIYPWYDTAREVPEVGGAFYAGLSRFTWAVAISWIIFACVKGYGGFINEFLSWGPFMPLGRLCFCVYLVSMHMQKIFHNGLKVPIRFEPYLMVNLYFAHMVMSYLLGFVATMLFESPFIILQKLIFEGK